VLVVNKFGNVILEDGSGAVWRICPEELSCTRIASGANEFEELRGTPDFVEEWSISRLVAEAERRFGEQEKGRCFCLKKPGVLGGEYHIDNVGTISVTELLSFSGNIGRQVAELPDGAEIEIKIK
jgi:hypothetical protein